MFYSTMNYLPTNCLEMSIESLCVTNFFFRPLALATLFPFGDVMVFLPLIVTPTVFEILQTMLVF